MKKSRFFIISVCFLLQNSLFALNIARPKIYAVIVGISSYQSKSLPLLRYADKDAGLFASYLQSPVGGNVPESQIKLLLNQNATIAAVYNAMDWLKEHCRNDDLVFIYFSGHGDIETKKAHSLGYLLAYNTPPNNYANNSISIENLNEEANTLTIKNKAKVILITDACHSGKLAGDFFKGKQFVAKQLGLVLNNEVRLASCGANQEAAEGVDWGGGRGVFSYYLLSGLNGLADTKVDGKIQLGEINQYLDSCFAADKYLKAGQHKQNPVTDGNTNFILAFTDSTALASQKTVKFHKITTANLPVGLQAFTALGTQPIDYFFSTVKNEPLESIIKFKSYKIDTAANIPQKIINDWIVHVNKIQNTSSATDMVDETFIKYALISMDTLQLLKDQLLKNKVIASRFNENFVQMVQDKCQEMINAYITGDLAELERRQYYYSGNRQYDDFLPMVELALKLVPKGHYLQQVLTIDYNYIAGLIARLNMVTQGNTDRLVQLAFYNQQKALQLEPYAAYIHNELGNLYFHQQKTDSAEYHFSLASVLSPSWAIPWSNKIRLYLAENNMPKALNAISKADSLQPGLSFLMMNAGLVMERTKNWLAAETMYNKAIDGNKVHFLPYERLGNIYLNTGQYDDADYFLFEAQTRKKDFKITDDYFKYGVELGGLFIGPTETHVDSCAVNYDGRNIRLTSYGKFIKLLPRLEIKNIAHAGYIQTVFEVLKQIPHMPLANHYLGKLLLEKGQWKTAENALLAAIADYQPNTIITRKKIIEQVYGNKLDVADHCLLNMLMDYQYDVLEDHYLLGYLYEKLKRRDEAIKQYFLISDIENKRQQAQAVYKGYPANPIAEVFRDQALYNKLLRRYNLPLADGSCIKLAGLYEQKKEYIKAEKILLNQISLNQAAGFARQATIEAKKPGTWQFTVDINFYWLAINRNMEGATYNFYKRMTSLFQRDYVWKERAGLFLYKRLALAYHQMPVAQYPSFSESINQFKYPWTSDELSAAADTTVITLPGSNEQIPVITPVFDPVKEALNWLRQSVQLSPNVAPKLKVAEAIADLNSWLGNREEAVKEYQEVINKQPGNAVFRNKVIDYLIGNRDFYAAYKQLDVLRQKKQLKPQQFLLLAEYKMLAGKYDESKSILKKYQPKNSMEIYKTKLLYAKTEWFSGKLSKAIYQLQYAVPKLNIGVKDDEDVKNDKNQQNCFRLYGIARLYSLLNKPGQAFKTLQQALESGFGYKYVLDNDSAWSAIRNDPNWLALTKNYTFIDYPPAGITTTNINPISYRIPNLHSK